MRNVATSNKIGNVDSEYPLDLDKNNYSEKRIHMDWYCSHSMAHFGTQDLSWGENQDGCSLSIPNNLNGSKIRILFANQ